MSLDENHLGRGAEVRHAAKRVLDVAALVAGRDHDAERRALLRSAATTRPQHGDRDERQPAEPGNRRHHDVQQRTEAEEVPRHVRDRPQADELETRQPRELREIGLRDERDDRRALPQAKPIGEPEQPGEVRVVERDDDAAAAADVRAHGFEQPLNVRRVIEISVEEKDVDGVRLWRYRRKIRRCADDLDRRVDRLAQHACVAGQRIDMDDAIGVAGDPGDLPPDQSVGPLPKMTGKCETQTANASIHMITTCESLSSSNDTERRFSAARNTHAA